MSRAQSKNVHVSAPSNRRTLTDARSAGSKFRRSHHGERRAWLRSAPSAWHAAGLATEVPQASVAPHVALRVLGMTLDGNAAELEIHPDPAGAPAPGAIATGGDVGCVRKHETNGSAVAGAVQRNRLFVVHGRVSFPMAPNVCMRREVSERGLEAFCQAIWSSKLLSRLRIEHDLANLLRAATSSGDPGSPNERLLP